MLKCHKLLAFLSFISTINTTSERLKARHFFTVSHFSYAPLLRAHIFHKMLESNILYDNLFIDCLLMFDDIEKKYRNHSCQSFCYAQGNFDKSARLHVQSMNVYIFYLRFALGNIHGDLCDRKTTKTIILFN